MGDSKGKEAQKTSYFKGLKQEFRKISWPDRMALVKETVAVVSVSVGLGLLISVIDVIVRYGVDLLVR